MYQLATEGGRFGPGGFGMPRADDNNPKTYVYDIDHRNNLCIATTKIQSIVGVAVDPDVLCPVATGATISTVTGGVIEGYDMYGQFITETVAALGTSEACFMHVVSAPTDALWANEFGLPYRYASDGGVPANVTYVAPADNTNYRGAFTWGGTFPAEVTLEYTVSRTNMFGDIGTVGPGPDEAAVTMSGTINTATGAIAISQTLLAAVDHGDTVTYIFPDGGQVVVNNTLQTVNYTLSSLYRSKYGFAAFGTDNLDKLVRAATNAGTHIVVDLTAS